MKETVPAALDGVRAELVARQLFDLSRGAVRRLCEDGRVRVDGKRVKKGDPVRAGALVELVGGSAWLVPDATVDVPILLTLPGLLVVDKPRGMPCHPLVPGEGGTLVDALVARFPEIAAASTDAREAGLVHRLDTDTSGCTAVARDLATWRARRADFEEGRVEKVYFALVQGRVAGDFVVDEPIDHDPADARRMVVGRGRPARTVVHALSIGPAHSAVRVVADWGRRHQVRVHLAARGHPLVGDGLYGARVEALPDVKADAPALVGHALHAWELLLPGLPRVAAPLPDVLVRAARALGCVPPSDAHAGG